MSGDPTGTTFRDGAASNDIKYSDDERERVYVSAERDGQGWIVSGRNEGIRVGPDRRQWGVAEFDESADRSRPGIDDRDEAHR